MPTDPHAPATPDLLELMHTILHTVRAGHPRTAGATGEDEEGAGKVGLMERKAIGFFARNPGATPSDLAAHSGRDKGQLARLLANLRDRGLLEAQPDADDRRVMRLYPTEKARQLHAEVQAQRRALAVRAVAGFSAAEQQTLLQLLQRVEQNLQALRD